MVSLMMVSQWLYRSETRLATLRLVCVRGSNYPWRGWPWDSTLSAARLPLGVPARRCFRNTYTALHGNSHLDRQVSAVPAFARAWRSGGCQVQAAHLWLKSEMQQIAIRLRSQGSRILRAFRIPSVKPSCTNQVLLKPQIQPPILQRNGQAVCGSPQA
jgi:hypothetical protein